MIRSSNLTIHLGGFNNHENKVLIMSSLLLLALFATKSYSYIGTIQMAMADDLLSNDSDNIVSLVTLKKFKLQGSPD